MAVRPILLIEDEPLVREATTAMLESFGYVVRACGHGREALDLLRSAACSPCLIILDFMMPDMDGATFIRERACEPAIASIPLIMFSARWDARETARRLGVPLVPKGPRVERLLRAVADYCAA